MKIQPWAIGVATVPAIVTFILIDTAVEMLSRALTDITLLSYFEQSLHRQYGVRFHVLNFIIFAIEMVFVMTLYATLRPLFVSRMRSVMFTVIFCAGFTGLILLQLVNLGLYPIQPAILFAISSLIGFPVAVYIGASVYERAVRRAAGTD